MCLGARGLLCASATGHERVLCVSQTVLKACVLAGLCVPVDGARVPSLCGRRAPSEGCARPCV